MSMRKFLDDLKWEAYFIIYVMLLPVFILILAALAYVFGYKLFFLKLGIVSCLPYLFVMSMYIIYVLEERIRLKK
jgi:hypothetical protein